MHDDLSFPMTHLPLSNEWLDMQEYSIRYCFERIRARHIIETTYRETLLGGFVHRSVSTSCMFSVDLSQIPAPRASITEVPA